MNQSVKKLVFVRLLPPRFVGLTVSRALNGYNDVNLSFSVEQTAVQLGYAATLLQISVPGRPATLLPMSKP